ncbi:transposase family protein [Mycobacterium ulcerans str. Harvey]|uniref:Transposase family protein n=1 Tax=Mycobacterium ulcerans str. Harvey TaxID=1299332 RepID=A0ABN0R995_MYCUL|nr:transposase family protein [Mycobacterium ulcerans str. Harvey]
MRGYAGFATWAATASDDVLAQLGVRFRRPSEKTFALFVSARPADLNARMGSYFTAHVAAATPVDWSDRVGRQDAAWCFTRKATATHLVSVFAHRARWCSVNSLSPRKQ